MLKSLKDKSSLKQIRNDILLGIGLQPENTCPLIDPLKSRERDKSHTYFRQEVKLGAETENYIVDINDFSKLISRTTDLKSWSEDMLELFENNVQEVPDNQGHLDMVKDQINYIKRCMQENEVIENNFVEITTNLKDLIKEWKEHNEEFESYEKDKEEFSKEKENVSYGLKGLDDDEDADEIDEIQIIMEHIENQIQDKVDDIMRLERNVNEISRGIDNANAKLDSNLEEYRSNNDGIREFTSLVRRYLIDNHTGELDITQPMEYLKLKESGKETEISLGVLNKLTLLDVSNYLEDNSIIGKLEKQIIIKINEPDKLLETLLKKGFSSIKYYNNEEDFINNRHNFQELKIKENFVKKNKLSI
jgi:hypothetical protein